MSARAFAFDLAQQSQTSNVTANLTPKSSYVRRNIFLQDMIIDVRRLCLFILVWVNMSDMGQE